MTCFEDNCKIVVFTMPIYHESEYKEKNELLHHVYV